MNEQIQIKGVSVIITITVAIILIATLVVPVISDVSYGRETYNNNTNIQSTYGITDENESFTIAVDESTGINVTMGETTTNYPITDRENYLFASDKCVVIQNWKSSNTSYGAYAYFFNDSGSNADFISTTTFAAGSLSYDAETKTVSFSDGGSRNYSEVVSWQYHVNPNGEYRTYQLPSGGTWYADPNNLIIAGAGWYSTGDNDTTYNYYSFNGVDSLNVGEAYQDDSQLNITTTEVDDDIVQCTMTISIGDETFTPWNVIIPKSVTSTNHTDWETLYWVIPVMLLVAILSYAVGSVYLKRDD